MMIFFGHLVGYPVDILEQQPDLVLDDASIVWTNFIGRRQFVSDLIPKLIKGIFTSGLRLTVAFNTILPAKLGHIEACF